MSRRALIGIAAAVLTAVLPPLTGADASDETKIVVSSAKTITPVVELYTSEGCSSCPPADDFLTRLGAGFDDDFRAVPLAFHVDYWNWLGWKDPFSQAEFTDRQRWIAGINQQGSIYTPELVVTGREARGGQQVLDLIASKNKETAKIHIMLEASSRGDGKLQANLKILNSAREGMPEVAVALYENNIIREIKGGENKNRTMTYNYVVRYLSRTAPVGAGETESALSMEIDEDWNIGNLGLAVLVIDTVTAETLQAVSTPLSRLDKVIRS